MSNVVNLNRFRKKKKRSEDEQRANENREKFGRTKTEKALDAAEKEKNASHLDAHRRDETQDENEK